MNKWTKQAIDINALLSKRRSPLKGLGMFFVTFGELYGVDGRVVVAIAGAETSFGTDPNSHADIAVHDAWGYDHPPEAKTGRPFPTWREGIRHVSWDLGTYYVAQGLDTIEKIAPRYLGYSPSPAWTTTVQAVYRQLGGDPAASVKVSLS